MKANQIPELQLRNENAQVRPNNRVIKNPHRKLPRKDFKDKMQRPRGEEPQRGRGNAPPKNIRFESQKKRISEK